MYKILKNPVGMTLIEVLVAVAIFSIVVAPLASFFIISNNRARHTLSQRQALAIAEAHVEQLRHDRFSMVFVHRAEGDEIPVIYDGKFTVYTEAEKVAVPSGNLEVQQEITRVTVRVEWSGGEVRISTLASTHR